MRVFRANLLGALVLSLMALATSAALASSGQEQPLFANDEALTLRIEAPLNTLFGRLLNADEYVEGSLYIVSGDGAEKALPVKIKPRGKTRRNKDYCRFPPLTVNFKKGETKGTVFAGQDKLKLVTHCKNKSKSYQQYYFLEYLIYKTYNLFTDISFDVRLAQIDYVDTEGKKSIAGHYGFFIEDADQLAERNQLERRKVPKIKISELDGKSGALVSVFQYFISNLDWSLLGSAPGENCCHNAKLFMSSTGDTIPVPYDFDHAGVVNARYATPPEGIKVRNVRERLYRGYCWHNDDLAPALESFREHKDEIYGLVEDMALLQPRIQKNTLNYYDQFYKTIGNPQSAQRALYDKCRGPK